MHKRCGYWCLPNAMLEHTQCKFNNCSLCKTKKQFKPLRMQIGTRCREFLRVLVQVRVIGFSTICLLHNVHIHVIINSFMHITRICICRWFLEMNCTACKCPQCTLGQRKISRMPHLPGTGTRRKTTPDTFLVRGVSGEWFVFSSFPPV